MARDRVLINGVWMLLLLLVLLRLTMAPIGEHRGQYYVTEVPPTPRPTSTPLTSPPPTRPPVEHYKFRDVVSASGWNYSYAESESEEQCRLSRSATKRNLGGRFHSMCTAHCFRKEEQQFRRPDFCFDDKRFHAKKFTFSAVRPNPDIVAGLQLFGTYHEKLNAVFVAAGDLRGPGGQLHTLKAIRQWRLYHPSSVSTVYLIVEDEFVEDPDIAAEATSSTIEVIPMSTVASPLISRFWDVFYIQGYMHPGGNRQTGNKKFNQLVSQRFHAIYGLMKERGLEHVVHLEGDNMIYGDMREVVRAVAACGHGMATLAAKPDGMIPGVVYIRDVAAVEQLVHFINDLLSCGLGFGKALKPGYANDMTYLMNYYEYYGSPAMGILPCWEHAAKENCVADLLERKVMFDSASFGQWYSFAEKAGKSVPPLHIRNSMKGRFIDATPGERLRWEADDQGRRIPYWKGYKLVSLHIHAKNLEKFRS